MHINNMTIHFLCWEKTLIEPKKLLILIEGNNRKSTTVHSKLQVIEIMSFSQNVFAHALSRYPLTTTCEYHHIRMNIQLFNMVYETFIVFCACTMVFFSMPWNTTEIPWFINIVIIHYHGIIMFSYMHYCNTMWYHCVIMIHVKYHSNTMFFYLE